jgi:hypothetical protein
MHIVLIIVVVIAFIVVSIISSWFNRGGYSKYKGRKDS